MKPDRKAPYLERTLGEYDAEERKRKAEAEGCEARVYHTGTDNIHRAGQLLRRRMTDDFGYLAGNSNYETD